MDLLTVDLALKAAIAATPVLLLLFAFDRVDLFNLISLRWIALLVLFGGVVAGLSFLANWRVMDGFPIGFSSYSRYVAPPVEETLKGLAVVLLFAANRIGFKLDAAISGFAVGAGFSMVENAWFLYALPDANIGAWLVRGFGTAVMHGGASALFAVVAHELTERQAEGSVARYRFNPLLFLPGLALATVLHSAFNHFAHEPMLAMVLTFVLVPMALFLVFARGEGATRAWLQADRDAHARALADIRAGDFAASPAGRAVADLVSRVKGRSDPADVARWVELKTELVLRAEELLLAAPEDADPDTPGRQSSGPGQDERDKFERLDALEKRLGRPLVGALTGRLGFSRNDLWELRRLRAQALGGPGRGQA